MTRFRDSRRVGNDARVARGVAIDLRGCFQETSTLNQELVLLAIARSPREGMHDAPAPEAVAIQGEEVGQRVESPADGSRWVWIGSQFIAPVAKQGSRIEGRVADERLWINRQPRLALGAQDVLGVKVLVQNHRLARARREVSDLADRKVEQCPLVRLTQ